VSYFSATLAHSNALHIAMATCLLYCVSLITNACFKYSCVMTQTYVSINTLFIQTHRASESDIKHFPNPPGTPTDPRQVEEVSLYTEGKPLLELLEKYLQTPPSELLAEGRHHPWDGNSGQTMAINRHSGAMRNF